MKLLSLLIALSLTLACQKEEVRIEEKVPAKETNAVDLSKMDLTPEMIRLDNEIYSAYLLVGEALANDDFETAKKQVVELETIAATVSEDYKKTNYFMLIENTINGMAVAEDIEVLRAVFLTFSNYQIGHIKANDIKLEKEFHVFYCSMRNASWAQGVDDIKNPYYGASMLKCGEKK